MGTTIAQAIPIAISPVLTRLFTPEDFGVLAVYMAIVGVLSAAATGRYELAIMLPEKDEDADALVVLSILIAVGLSLLALIMIAVFNAPIASLVGNDKLEVWLYAVPASLFLSGAYNALNYWLNRHKRYITMGKNRVLQSGLTGGTKLALGWANGGAAGLIFGAILGQSVTTAMLGKQFLVNRDVLSFIYSNMLKSKELAIRYSNHPCHLLPAQWIGSAAMQIPVFVISSTFGVIVTGFYSLVDRLISLPTLLIANAIGDVYRQQASVRYRETGEFRQIYLKTLSHSIKIAVIPFVALLSIAPELFAFVFGEPWRLAGEYARILAVASFFQFIFTPIDKGALIVGATRYIFFWHLARLVGLIVIAISTSWLALTVETVLVMLVLVNVLLYSVEGIIGYRCSTGLMMRPK